MKLTRRSADGLATCAGIVIQILWFFLCPYGLPIAGLDRWAAEGGHWIRGMTPGRGFLYVLLSYVFTYANFALCRAIAIRLQNEKPALKPCLEFARIRTGLVTIVVVLTLFLGPFAGTLRAWFQFISETGSIVDKHR